MVSENYYHLRGGGEETLASQILLSKSACEAIDPRYSVGNGELFVTIQDMYGSS